MEASTKYQKVAESALRSQKKITIGILTTFLLFLVVLLVSLKEHWSQGEDIYSTTGDAKHEELPQKISNTIN